MTPKALAEVEAYFGPKIGQAEFKPALELIERAGPQDPPVAHSDVAGEGLAGVHRQDATCRIDNGAHDRGFFFRE